LDVGALEEVQGGLLEAALWRRRLVRLASVWEGGVVGRRGSVYSSGRRRAADLLGFA